MSELRIILPERAEDEISDGLRQLTFLLEKATGDSGGYGLGGAHGYGVDFANEVFEMRRFYWGDCDCGYNDREEEFSARYEHKDVPWGDFPAGDGHAPTCSLELPNFRHKASGFTVKWYKWIGRDMEVSGDPDAFEAILAECIRSVVATPTVT